MSGRQPRQRCCLVRSARVGHHDSALLVTREIGVSQFAMFDATSMPRCSIESSPAAADMRTDSGRQIDGGGIGQERPYLKSRCHTVRSAIWYADVGNRHCVRVREGGEVLTTVELDRGAFACTLSRGDPPQLYVVGQEWGGPEPTEPTGQLGVFPAPAPGAGKP